MWLEEHNFSDLIRGWWKDLKVSGWEGFRLVTIFKKLKAFIKDWVASQFGSVEQSLASRLLEIQQIDIKEESSSVYIYIYFYFILFFF